MYKLLRKIKFIQLLRALTRRKKHAKGKTFVRIKFPQTDANLLAYSQQIYERISLNNFPIPPEMKENFLQAVSEFESAMAAVNAGEGGGSRASLSSLLSARQRMVSRLKQLGAYFQGLAEDTDKLQSTGFRTRPMKG